jgi:A/G-specific adenine glycosylase
MDSALALWYSQHSRPLPWRSSRDPYAILVSEVMAQQKYVLKKDLASLQLFMA